MNTIRLIIRHRITPAGAGKTACSRWYSARTWDHPRRCGENFDYFHAFPFLSGSPPQVRGKLTKVKQGITEQRITPAGAGKTLFQQRHGQFPQDHPRRCGENCTPVMVERCPSGSPPQVRGKPKLADSASAAVGITPAGAGKTHRHNVAQCIIRDHPRRCGENYKSLFLGRLRGGSPPQVRGKLKQIALNALALWITPAGAGKTITPIFILHRQKDHPRRCGENGVKCCKMRLYVGSPPQVRGKLAIWLLYSCCARITPAGAGKTLRKGGTKK